MKGTGIIRRLDDLGRIVIPKDVRRTLMLKEGDPMELFMIEGGVAFKKYDPNKDVESAIQGVIDMLKDDLTNLSRLQKQEVIKLLDDARSLVKNEGNLGN